MKGNSSFDPDSRMPYFDSAHIIPTYLEPLRGAILSFLPSHEQIVRGVILSSLVCLLSFTFPLLGDLIGTNISAEQQGSLLRLIPYVSVTTMLMLLCGAFFIVRKLEQDQKCEGSSGTKVSNPQISESSDAIERDTESLDSQGKAPVRSMVVGCLDLQGREPVDLRMVGSLAFPTSYSHGNYTITGRRLAVGEAYIPNHLVKVEDIEDFVKSMYEVLLGDTAVPILQAEDLIRVENPVEDAFQPIQVTRGSKVLRRRFPIGPQSGEAQLDYFKKLLAESMKRAVRIDKNCTLQFGSYAVLKYSDSGLRWWKLERYKAASISNIERSPWKLVDLLIGGHPKWTITGCNLQAATLSATTAEVKEELKVLNRSKAYNGEDVILCEEARLIETSAPNFRENVYICASKHVQVEEKVSFNLQSEARNVKEAYWNSVIHGSLHILWVVIVIACFSRWRLRGDEHPVVHDHTLTDLVPHFISFQSGFNSINLNSDSQGNVILSNLWREFCNFFLISILIIVVPKLCSTLWMFLCDLYEDVPSGGSDGLSVEVILTYEDTARTVECMSPSQEKDTPMKSTDGVAEKAGDASSLHAPYTPKVIGSPEGNIVESNVQTERQQHSNFAEIQEDLTSAPAFIIGNNLPLGSASDEVSDAPPQEHDETTVSASNQDESAMSSRKKQKQKSTSAYPLTTDIAENCSSGDDSESSSSESSVSSVNTSTSPESSQADEEDGAERSAVAVESTVKEERAIHGQVAEDKPVLGEGARAQSDDQNIEEAGVTLSVDYDAGGECPPHGTTSVCGRRREMEDAVAAIPLFLSLPCDTAELVSSVSNFHFFGVYDGHGGSQVALHCADRLHHMLAEEMTSVMEMPGPSLYSESWDPQWRKALRNCFLDMDDEVGGEGKSEGSSRQLDGSVQLGREGTPPERIAPETVGSSAVVAIVGSRQLIIANCGDCRAVLSRGGTAMALSYDHKPDREDELARIEGAGGSVIFWNGYRVLGVLAMSRAIGDRYLKPFVIAEPEVTFTQRTEDDECLILASDGVWDVMSNDVVCDVARKCLTGQGRRSSLDKSARDRVMDKSATASALLTKMALARGSSDNISVVVVDLRIGHRR